MRTTIMSAFDFQKMCGVIIRCVLAVLLSVMLSVVPVWAGLPDSPYHVETLPGSNVEISIISPIQTLPLKGYLPLKIKINNKTSLPHSWHFDFVSAVSGKALSRYESSKDISVGENREQITSVLVPLRERKYGGSYVEISVSGYGTAGSHVLFSGVYQSYTGHPRPYIGLGKEISLRSQKVVEEELRAQKAQFSSSAVDLSQIPADWRALAGVDQLWITDFEWNVELQKEARLALQEWVLQGGKLFICIQSLKKLQFPDLDLSHFDSVAPINGRLGTLSLGLGEIGIHLWDGVEVDSSKIIVEHNSQVAMFKSIESSSLSKSWSLAQSIPPFEHRAGIILLLLALYAFSVGPVNIFVLASRERRAKLFFTTPIISFIACVLLASLILLQDGTGGMGLRTEYRILIPNYNRTVVFQEQVSKTGLLLNSDFSLDERAYLRMLPLESSAEHSYGALDRLGERYGGNWFASRTIQGHLIETVEASRERIEILMKSSKGEKLQAPSVTTFLSQEVEELFYIDDEGGYWYSGSVGVGETKDLIPASKSGFESWFEEVKKQQSPSVKQHLMPFIDLTGFEKEGTRVFFAKLKGDEGMYATLPSVQWKQSDIYIMGLIKDDE